MAFSVRDALAAKGVHPTDEHLKKLEGKWAEIEQRRNTLDGIRIDDADIAVRSIPGGDHVVR